MSREVAKLLAGGNVPEFQRMVIAAGKGGAAIRGKGDRRNGTGMSREGADKPVLLAPLCSPGLAPHAAHPATPSSKLAILRSG